MIEINERFAVAAPPAEVYKVMSDPHAVVECVAGAALAEQNEDGTYVGSMTVKFSALRVSFAGKVGLELDEANHQGSVIATGRDKQGGTKFKATAAFTVEPADGGATSLVTTIGEIDLAGKLASVIEGAANAVVRRMTGEFVEALSIRCASDSASLGPAASISEPDAAVAPATAVLLLHDFGASPSGVRAWGDALAAAGAVVSIPRLPGHGTRWKDLDKTTWAQWYESAGTALATLLEQHDKVVIMGTGLGATLALRLAQDHPDGVAGVVAVNPVISGLAGAKKLLGLRRILRRSRPAVVNDAKKVGVQDVGYDRVPLAAAGSVIALGSVVRAGLPAVRVPVLLGLSAVDHVIDRADGEVVWSTLPPGHRRRIELADSYHLATVDNDAERLFAESAAFMAETATRTLATR